MSDELDVLRARVAELERCAERAEADATRLREVLAQVRDAMLATGQAPDGDDDPRRPVAAAVWRALASTPSAEPTPRDMRVAEAVREACAKSLFTCTEHTLAEAVARGISCAHEREQVLIRAIDLAAVVAKAVGT